MRQCVINGITIGGDAPPRIMGVINCSPESFYANSYIPIDLVHKTAVGMVEQGADIIDIGADIGIENNGHGRASSGDDGQVSRRAFRQAVA